MYISSLLGFLGPLIQPPSQASISTRRGIYDLSPRSIPSMNCLNTSLQLSSPETVSTSQSSMSVLKEADFSIPPSTGKSLALSGSAPSNRDGWRDPKSIPHWRKRSLSSSNVKTKSIASSTPGVSRSPSFAMHGPINTTLVPGMICFR